MPDVKPPTVSDVPVTQPSEVKVPPEKESNWMFGLVKAEPTELKVIVALLACATNWYHTSAPGVPAHVLATAGEDAVAPESIPVVLVHVVADVSELALV
jgi:hypothetical protein